MASNTTGESSADDYFPIREVYDLHRLALLNAKYYGYRLHQLRLLARCIDLATAFSTMGTGASVVAINTMIGKAALKYVAGLSALLGVARPVLALSGKIERVTRLRTNYENLLGDVGSIVRDIQSRHALSRALEVTVRSLEKRFKDLEIEGDPHPSRKLIGRFQDEVEQEMPFDRLWRPTRAPSASEGAAKAQ